MNENAKSQFPLKTSKYIHELIKILNIMHVIHLFSTMGTHTVGFFLRPSMMSWPRSPYILWIALRWMTSEDPPKVLSSLKRSCSSADIRESLCWTDSSARIVARLVSNTTSSWGDAMTGDWLKTTNGEKMGRHLKLRKSHKWNAECKWKVKKNKKQI